MGIEHKRKATAERILVAGKRVNIDKYSHLEFDDYCRMCYISFEEEERGKKRREEKMCMV